MDSKTHSKLDVEQEALESIANMPEVTEQPEELGEIEGEAGQTGATQKLSSPPPSITDDDKRRGNVIVKSLCMFLESLTGIKIDDDAQFAASEAAADLSAETLPSIPKIYRAAFWLAIIGLPVAAGLLAANKGAADA
jgi:hypothetical protein